MTARRAAVEDLDELIDGPLDEQMDEPVRLRLAADEDLGLDPPDPTDPSRWPEPEDRGSAVLSELGDVEYVEDLIRPGRIVVVAAEEGTGKSYAIDGELGIRIAAAGGSFAGTWPILRTGPVLVLSEMHSDDDWHREAQILEALELERSALAGRYWRLPLMTAAGGAPALTVAAWRAWVTAWLQGREALLLVVDTATGATAVDPWGKAIQDVYRDLRSMLAEYPELAIVLVLHLKKPNGRGDRRISDVLGEWGRWNDITIMLETDGATRTRISTHKRIRHPRRIVATKADGLLVEPFDLDETKTTKVPAEAVVAAIMAEPGIAQRALAKVLEVSSSTAAKYAESAEAAGLIYRVDLGRGKGFRLYPAENPLDTQPSNGPTPSNEATGHPPDGALEGSGEGVSNGVHPPEGVDTHSTGHPTVGATVDCRDYAAHQSKHRRVADGWVCDACSADPLPPWLL